MKDTPAAARYRMFQGDCNAKIGDVVAEIPDGALTLAFLDPTGLHVSMKTVTTLADCGAVDLVILFPDAMDVIRNENAYYFDNPGSKLDQVLGEGSNWRAKKNSLPNQTPLNLRRLFTGVYKEQLRRLANYQYIDDIPIQGAKGPLYRLVYASKSDRGLDFWRKSIAKEIGGQTSLFDG